MRILLLIDFWDYDKHDLEINRIQNLRKLAAENTKILIHSNYFDFIVNENYSPKARLISELDFAQCYNSLLTFKNLAKILKDKNVQEVHYAGIHWNMCIKDRPTGWKNLLNYKNKKNLPIKIMFNDKTIVSQHHDGTEYWPCFEEDNMTLTSIYSKNVYELIRDKTVKYQND